MVSRGRAKRTRRKQVVRGVTAARHPVRKSPGKRREDVLFTRVVEIIEAARGHVAPLGQHGDGPGLLADRPRDRRGRAARREARGLRRARSSTGSRSVSPARLRQGLRRAEHCGDVRQFYVSLSRGLGAATRARRTLEADHGAASSEGEDSVSSAVRIGGEEARSPGEKIRSAVLSESEALDAAAFPPYLGWTHYLVLLRVANPAARAFYEIEAARESWSSRELERQIASLLFERLAKSRDKDKVLALARQGPPARRPRRRPQGSLRPRVPRPRREVAAGASASSSRRSSIASRSSCSSSARASASSRGRSGSRSTAITSTSTSSSTTACSAASSWSTSSSASSPTRISARCRCT